MAAEWVHFHHQQMRKMQKITSRTEELYWRMILKVIHLNKPTQQKFVSKGKDAVVTLSTINMVNRETKESNATRPDKLMFRVWS